MPRKYLLIIQGVAYVILKLFFFAIFMAIPTMLLWNWLMPDIFGLCKIDYFQSCGLLLLTSFLFGHNTNTSNHRDEEELASESPRDEQLKNTK